MRIARRLIFAVVLGLGAALFLSMQDSQSNPGTVSVVIAPGASGGQAAHALKGAGVIRSQLLFRAAVRISGAGKDLKPGKYRLRRNMGTNELLRALRRGPAIRVVRVVIPEGFTLNQIADRLAKRTHIRSEEFLAAAKPAATRIIPEIVPRGAPSLEGALFPATYEISENQTALGVVQSMVHEFERRTRAIGWGKAAARAVSAYQALIVASLVEEEARIEEERPLVASVIYNRLRKGMKLEIDATVLYALGGHKSTLSPADLAVDSPYNTRRVAGLPPSPISNPGIASIKAALNPAETDYLYYVLTDCRSHAFSSSYSEFINNKKSAKAC